MPGRVPHRRPHFNILGFIGMVVFLCGMILAVGVYLYKGFNEKSLESKKQELQQLKSAFSEDDIAELRALDRRIKVTHALLDGHLSPSVVFDALELRTQHDVSFTDFSYEQRESGSVEIVLEGTALRFNTVALQSRQLADAKVLASTIFSGLSVDEDGVVHFTATSEADKKLLAYSVVAPETSTPASAATTTPPASSATTTPPAVIPPPAVTPASPPVAAPAGGGAGPAPALPPNGTP